MAAKAEQRAPLDRAEALGRDVEYLARDFLARQRILIAGAGAVGSTLFDLCLRQGVGKLGLVDYDKVEAHNAATGVFDHRDVGKHKVEALKERATAGHGLEASRVEVFSVPVQQVGLGVFRGYDAGVIAVDNVMSRVDVNRKLIRPGLIGVDQGIELANGRFTHTHPEGPCFECRLDAAAYLAWDTSYPCATRASTDAPTVASASASYITAGSALNTLLQRLHRREQGQDDPYRGIEFVVCGGGSFLHSYEVSGKNCRAVHQPLDDAHVQRRTWRSDSITLAQILEQARGELGPGVTLRLEQDLVLSCRCDGCGHRWDARKTLSYLQGNKPPCPGCGARRIPLPLETLSCLGPGSRAPRRALHSTLAKLGFPLDHLLSVAGPQGDLALYLQVAGDEEVLKNDEQSRANVA